MVSVVFVTASFGACVVLAVVVAALVFASGNAEAALYAGPSILKTGLRRLRIEDAYVRRKQPGLTCHRAPGGGECVFGVYSLTNGSVGVMLSTHLAGAVYRLVYAGLDFVFPMPVVGGSMQTAMTFDAREAGSFEAYNPTEAGCGECDSHTGRSSSVMLELWASNKAVYTATRLAFFRRPGSTLPGRIPVRNTTQVSDVVHSKRLEFVADGVLDYIVAVQIPERYHFSLLEVLACWVPTKAAAMTEVRTGAQWRPLVPKTVYWMRENSGMVFAEQGGRRAMGVVLLDWPRGAMFDEPRFGVPAVDMAAGWKKWNIVQRIGNNANYKFTIPAGTYSWKVRLFFGDVTKVRAMIEAVEDSIPGHSTTYRSFLRKIG